MKITKSQLRKIIKEESAKVLSEYYPGFDDDVAAAKNKEREDSRKNQQASHARREQNKVHSQGIEDGKDLDKAPAQSDNESYMKGYLKTRGTALRQLISRSERAKKQYTGFKGSSIAAAVPGTKTNKDVRNLLKNISNVKRELSAVEDGSWLEKYGK
jgi:hypothetical protein